MLGHACASCAAVCFNAVLSFDPIYRRRDERSGVEKMANLGNVTAGRLRIDQLPHTKETRGMWSGGGFHEQPHAYFITNRAVWHS